MGQAELFQNEIFKHKYYYGTNNWGSYVAIGFLQIKYDDILLLLKALRKAKFMVTNLILECSHNYTAFSLPGNSVHLELNHCVFDLVAAALVKVMFTVVFRKASF